MDPAAAIDTDRRRRPTHYALGAGPDSDADRRRLWDTCRALVERAGISVGEP